MPRRLILTAALLAAVPAQAATLENEKISNWHAGAYSNDKTGKFSHCAMITRYNSGIILGFHITKERSWGILAVNERWNLTKGDKIDIVFTIDEKGPITAKAVAVERDRVIIGLNPSGQLFEKFRHGAQLQVFVLGQVFKFNLDGTARGLSYLSDCVNRHTRMASNPFPSSPRSTPPAPSSSSGVTPPPRPPSPNVGATASADLQAEAMRLAANLLGTAGVTGFKFLAPQEKPAQLRSAHAVWLSSGILGMVEILPGSSDLPEVARDLVGLDQSACNGKFASAVSPESSGGLTMLNVFTGCEPKEGSAVVVHYNLMSRAAGGAVMFGVVGSGDAEDRSANKANQINRELREAAFTAFSPAAGKGRMTLPSD